MYEHIRAHLLEDVAAAEVRVTAAIARRDQAAADLEARRADVVRFQQSAAEAEAALAARQGELAAAQGVVNQRAAERDTASDAVDQAQHDFDAHGGDEPPFFDNPQDLANWVQERNILRGLLDDAQDAFDATLPPLNQAIAARNAVQATVDAAAGLLGSRRSDVQRAMGEVTFAEQRLANAEGGIIQARADVDAAKAKITALDQREARLKAALESTPIDRPALEKASDEEEADLQVGWQARRSAFERRVFFREGRGGVLFAHDSTVDELARFRNVISGWPDAPAFPGLAAVVSGLGEIVAANAAQRPRLPLEPSDAIGAIHDQLISLMFQLQDLTGLATQARDSAAQQLNRARDDLNAHQEP